MPYSKESPKQPVPVANLLDILTEWAGDYRANERERAECPKCGTIAASDKCLGITATVAKDADDSLRFFLTFFTYLFFAHDYCRAC